MHVCMASLGMSLEHGEVGLEAPMARYNSPASLAQAPSGWLGNARGVDRCFWFSTTPRAACMRQKIIIAARKMTGLQEEAGIQSMQDVIKGQDEIEGLPCPVNVAANPLRASGCSLPAGFCKRRCKTPV